MRSRQNTTTDNGKDSIAVSGPELTVMQQPRAGTFRPGSTEGRSSAG
jgi:hypothetical protein